MKLMQIKTGKQQHGFSLVEVLIALIIMSVGMLGIATLFVQSMQAGRTSMFRHHAVTLAGDVADRIRANPRARGEYALAGANNNCVAAGVVCADVGVAAVAVAAAAKLPVAAGAVVSAVAVFVAACWRRLRRDGLCRTRYRWRL